VTDVCIVSSGRALVRNSMVVRAAAAASAVAAGARAAAGEVGESLIKHINSMFLYTETRSYNLKLCTQCTS
jgi:hypothetical protein